MMEHDIKKGLVLGFLVGACVGSVITFKSLMFGAMMSGLIKMPEDKSGMMGPCGQHMQEMRMHARRKMMMMREHWMGKKGCCEDEEEGKPEEAAEQPAEEA
ncbi:MAG: hypothetical protein ACYC6L_16420 [Anaerolineae bacterium]